MKLAASLAVFEAALALAEEDRAAYVRDATATDPELKAAVEALFAAHARSQGFLEPPQGRAPQTIGPYELLECLGEGGMGVVYRARRRDGLYSKDVALKRVRVPDAEMGRRLERERAIVGALAHPNIASLLDGGTDAEGVPYLVLEYIDGAPLNQWIERAQPSLHRLLDVAVAILDALAYAHARLIVHRDLKPGNILIDSRGQPKLVDFGIARVIDPVANVETALSMTPAYAAPEQLRNETPTALSDLYSFAVVLYEMLTGQLPCRPERTDIVAWVEAIMRQEPRPASQVASSPARRRELGGDLDAVLAKALDKDPARRYQSAQELGVELKRVLDGYPVLARVPGRVTRSWKFVRRNSTFVLATLAVVSALVIGSALALWQSVEARHERDRAIRQRNQAEAVSALMQRMLSFTDPLVAGDHNAGETTVHDILKAWERRIQDGEFDNEPAVKVELLRILAESFSSAGQYDQHRRYVLAWSELARARSAEDPGEALRAEAASGAAHQSSTSEQTPVSLDRMLEHYRSVLPRLEAAHARGELGAAPLIQAHNEFAYLRRTQGHSDEAEAAFRRSLELAPELRNDQFSLISTVRSTLASTLSDQGRFAEAVAESRRSIAEFEAQPARMQSPNYGFALTVLGGFLSESGELAEAEKLLAEAERILRLQLGKDTLWIGDNLRNQALLALLLERPTQALQQAQEARRIYDASFGETYDHYPTVLLAEAGARARLGEVTQAEALYQRALALRRQLLPAEHYFTAMAQLRYAEFLVAQNRLADARMQLEPALQTLLQKQGRDNPRTRLAQGLWERIEAAGR
jgi:serine/threonine-protein kinase